MDDDMPPLVGADGAALYAPSTAPAAASPPTTFEDHHTSEEAQARLLKDAEAIRAAAALRAAAAAREAARLEAEGPADAAEAMRLAMAESTEPEVEQRPVSEVTKRMLAAITRDDFEECEDAILQGADLSSDVGGGMQALHVSAMRGEMFLTELLIAHGAGVNQRDMSGNTPLLYALHFYRQHGRGVPMTAQLLHHRADPFYRVKDGKLAGSSALDMAEKACREPNMDENAPRQMCGMIKLAMDDSDYGRESITKVWMGFKSENKKLYQVSSSKDTYNYAVKSVDWTTPDDARNAQACEPVRLEGAAESILDEKFMELKDYSFSDEGDKVKVYITFPDSAAPALGTQDALDICYEFQAFDLKLRTAKGGYRLRLEPLFGSIDGERCKHRVSAAANKVTLTLAKRHANKPWRALQGAR